ncbi:hypothetical protein FOA52_001856 [Chlamydomonas sp. UWO 241]|nr:hypothetical protein FOA52_001856 [Chlamydomonas sp. UWO 241]
MVSLRAEERNPRHEFANVDKRRIHALAEPLSLSDLPRSSRGTAESHEGQASTLEPSLLPKLRLAKYLHPAASCGGSTGQDEAGTATWSPAAAALQQLHADRPELVDRMERTVAQAKTVRGNRKYRMDSLGVFDSEVNETRARTMFRVKMHNELSPVFMRVPRDIKEIKSHLQGDSLSLRLERMCAKVVSSIEEPRPGDGGASTRRSMSQARRKPRLIGSLSIKERAGGGGGPLSPGAQRVSPGAALSRQASHSWGLESPPGGGHAHSASQCGLQRQSSGWNTAPPPRRVSIAGGLTHSPSGKSAGDAAVGAASVGSASGAPVRRSQSGCVRRGSRDGGKAAAGGGGVRDMRRSQTGCGCGSGAEERASHSAGSFLPTPAVPAIPTIAIPTTGHPGGLSERSKSTSVAGPALRSARAGGGGGGGGGRGGLKGADFAARVAYQPELAMAQLQELADKTEAHLNRYHEVVLQAQERALLHGGLPPELLNVTPEELEALLLRGENEDAAGAWLEPVNIKDVSHRIANTHDVSQLAAAALEHVEGMDAELSDFKEQLPASYSFKEEPLSPRRRRLTATTSTFNYHSGMSTAAPSRLQSMHMRLGSPPLRAAGAAGAARAGSSPGKAAGPGAGAGGIAASIEAAAAALAGCGAREEGGEERGGGSGALLAAAPPPPPPAAPPPPAPMKPQPPILTPERLQEFGADLAAAAACADGAHACAPGLPELPGAPTESLALQAQLERIWEMLRLPLIARLDMVLEFTRKERVLQFGPCLEMWERAAGAVVRRERLLSQLSTLQQGLEEGGGLVSVSVRKTQVLCVDIVEATVQVTALARQLATEYSSQLTYDGHDYPGPPDEQLGASHLVKFMAYLAAYKGPVHLTRG